jgi:hypothetical protein
MNVSLSASTIDGDIDLHRSLFLTSGEQNYGEKPYSVFAG